MFGGPPPPTPAELKQQEDTARQTVVGALTMCLVLYISPFIVDSLKALA